MEPIHHPFAELIDLEILEQNAGNSRLEIDFNEKLLNPQGVVHGAVLYALSDTGMGAALYPMLEEGEYCATIEIKITYFSAFRAGRLLCDTRVLKRGKRIAMLESDLTVDGQAIAKASGSFSIFKPSFG